MTPTLPLSLPLSPSSLKLSRRYALHSRGIMDQLKRAAPRVSHELLALTIERIQKEVK